jgi:Ca2+-transporting ATPase
VPGDIVVIEGGDVVTADLRLIQASKLLVDESALTGESFPVSKDTEPVAEETLLAERMNMLFKGTAVTRGSAEGVVVATGMQTELGRISSLVAEAEEQITPLEKSLNRLAHNLIWVTLVIAGLVTLGGILSRKEIFLMIETGIALAVAAIPEGLPIVATIALAKGVWRMARRNALINRLSAVETLGGTDVICTDKTGTLTENLMTVQTLAPESGRATVQQSDQGNWGFLRNGEHFDPKEDELILEMLRVGILCNNASYETLDDGSIKPIGDPLETALVILGTRAGLNPDELRVAMEEIREEAFDPETKMMATVHEDGDQYYVAVKGAAESVLGACSKVLTPQGLKNMEEETRRHWDSQNEKMAEEGLRVLAFAMKHTSTLDANSYEQLVFLGLMGFLDPPRRDVQSSIRLCQEAGIRVIMVTGDQPITARIIASAVGLGSTDEFEVIHGRDLKDPEGLSIEEKQRILRAPVFARVNPKQKLDLIKAHQMNGSVVAMTGDGVNDAPALKKADIGVAMGLRGTQVAQEAADMVLKDDAFSTIVFAVQQGRIIFRNIRRCVLYLLSCNLSEVMSVGLAALVNAPLPILPLQILFLNLITDVFPAMAMGVGEGDETIMKNSPRDPKKPILTRSHWLSIAGYGFLIMTAVLGALALALTVFEMEERKAVSVSFLTLAFAQLWHVFNMRERNSQILNNDIVRNSFVWGSMALCSALLLAAVYMPGLRDVLRVVDPGPKGWLLVAGMSLVPFLVGQILKAGKNTEN